MRRTTFLLLTALFTFTVGVIAYFLWVPHNYSNEVTSVQTGEVDLRWVYINKDLHWEHPPKEVGLDYSYSGINILVLYPNGLFASITGTVYQIEKPSRIMLVPNEGFGVYKGTWKRNGDGTITVIS